jgi:hypothetical protein
MSGATEDTQINVGGVWKDIDNAEVNVSGTWKDVNCIWTNVAGVWKRAWTNYDVQLSGENFSSGSQCRIYVQADGQMGVYVIEVGYPVPIDTATDWIIPNSAAAAEADFEAKWVLTAGSAPTQKTVGWNENTYMDTTSDLYVGINSAGAAICDVTITIRRKSDSVVLATGLYEMTVY